MIKCSTRNIYKPIRLTKKGAEFLNGAANGTSRSREMRLLGRAGSASGMQASTHVLCSHQVTFHREAASDGQSDTANAQNTLPLVCGARTLHLAISSLPSLVALNTIYVQVGFKCIFPRLVAPQTPDLSLTAYSIPRGAGTPVRRVHSTAPHVNLPPTSRS